MSGGPGPLLRANFRTRGPESQEEGVSSSKFITKAKTQKRDRRNRGPAGPPGASRGLQGPPGASSPANCGGPRQGPSRVSSLQGTQTFWAFRQNYRFAASEIAYRGLQAPGASSRGLGGLQEPLTSFKLSGLSTYANEEVLLLTKMDLTEFRS